MKKVLLSMGSCVSMRENPPDATVNWSLYSKDEALPSKIAASGPQLNSTPANKEEVFFDSQAWIESDSEEFMSVNGDSTPSFGTSPNRKLNNAGGIIVVDQKKKLSDLFCESFSNDHERDINVIHNSVSNNTAAGDCDETDNRKGVEVVERRKSMRGGGYCLPGIVRSLSCGERKKRQSNGHIAGG